MTSDFRLYEFISALLLGMVIAFWIVYLVFRYDDKIYKAVKWFESFAKKGRKL